MRNNYGMSLIEILIALALLALAGTFITGQVMDSYEEGRVKSAKIQIQNLQQRLMEFRRHCGFFPYTEQGLDALVEKPTAGRECKNYAPNGYIAGGKVPLDPWDYEFEYECSDGKKYIIKSLGSDGAEGGEGWDKDITSDDLGK